MADRTKNQVSVAGFQHTNNSIASLLDCPLRQPQHHSKSQSALLHPCTLAYLSSFLFHFFFEPLHDFPIVFFFVRKQAAGAVLDASFCIGKGTAAVFYKVQGTKAEEAVEILSIAFLVTRKTHSPYEKSTYSAPSFLFPAFCQLAKLFYAKGLPSARRLDSGTGHPGLRRITGTHHGL